MKTILSFRPDDYRHIWADAYDKSIRQGVQVQLRSAILLARSEQSIKDSKDMVQQTVELLETTVATLSKKLEAQGALQVQKLGAAAHALFTEHAKLRQTELRLQAQQAQHAQQTATLQSERNAFEAAKRLFYRKPFWRRVFEAACMPPAARSTSPKSSQIK